MSSTEQPTAPLRVAVLVASTREGRFAPVVTRWLTGHLGQRPDL
ncbi:NADPH-dependent FMN reductase, partial [Streptomyces sp. SID5785]|nr:NADPH-dependent FMN reductase [Streptomyces sp. SID5785]